MDDEIKEQLYRKGKMKFTKKLRRVMTPEEKILWELLRNRHSRGVKFRRQVNIGQYIVDFLCKEQKVVLEIDGGVHDTEQQKEHDQTRTVFLEEHGYTVLRIKNEDIHNNLQGVLHTIHKFLRNIQQTKQ